MVSQDQEGRAAAAPRRGKKRHIVAFWGLRGSLLAAEAKWRALARREHRKVLGPVFSRLLFA